MMCCSCALWCMYTVNQSLGSFQSKFLHVKLVLPVQFAKKLSNKSQFLVKNLEK